jgi:hypothetical protein
MRLERDEMSHREPSRSELQAMWARLDETEVRKVSEEAEAKERAAIVAWLRRVDEPPTYGQRLRMMIADEIEAGAHRQG